MTILDALRAHYDQHGIGALRFLCKHADSCRRAPDCVRFTEATEAFVGTDYEKGTLPRLLFVSIDSGDALEDPALRTMEAVRRREEEADVTHLHRGKHWWLTHEMCAVLLAQFKSDLTAESITPYFAHVTSAKCCQNKPERARASSVLFRNCREYIPAEIQSLQPDIIVTQGDQAWAVLTAGFPRIHEVAATRCASVIVGCGDRQALWIHTYHPRYGGFWAQKRECWTAYASMVGRFISGITLTDVARVPSLPRLVRTSGREVGPQKHSNSHIGALPTSIEELIAASRSVTSPASFEDLVTRMRGIRRARRNIGVFTGMAVQQFQNWQLDENPKLRLSDAQILAVMRVEFPLNEGKVFTGSLEEGLKIVSGIRSGYNRDGHNGPTSQERGMPLSVSYGRL